MVIILLYVGLLASFSLNVSLLLRKQPLAPPHNEGVVATEGSGSGAEAGKGKEPSVEPEWGPLFIILIGYMVNRLYSQLWLHKTVHHTGWGWWLVTGLG